MLNLDEIVGQEEAKSKLSFAFNGYKASGIFMPTIFVAPKGNGKTSMAKCLAKELVCPSDPTKIKPFLRINCSTIRNTAQFVNRVLLPMVIGREVTLFLDEASEIPKDLSMNLLSVLDLEKGNKNVFVYGDMQLDIDFSKITWLLATSEIQKVFNPLLDRLERIDLQDYTTDQLCEIARKGAAPSVISNKAMEEIKRVFRGHGRDAFKLGNKINLYLQSIKENVLSLGDWLDIKKQLYIHPLGLSPLEIQVLEILEKCGECSLTSLAAKTGLSRACVQRDIEIFLLRHHLIGIEQRGRVITKLGRDILKEVRGI
jgi:Holliday junction resolvasome RuvABC ATP-dependent DNA helicase subunit